MKKTGLVICLITLLLLSGCSKKGSEDPKDSTQSTDTATSKESSMENSSSGSIQEFSSIDSSNVDDVRKEVPTDSVSTLRRELYQAGINSSTLTDDELVHYQQEATAQGIDFTDYVKGKLKE